MNGTRWAPSLVGLEHSGSANVMWPLLFQSLAKVPHVDVSML